MRKQHSTILKCSKFLQDRIIFKQKSSDIALQKWLLNKNLIKIQLKSAQPIEIHTVLIIVIRSYLMMSILENYLTISFCLTIIRY